MYKYKDLKNNCLAIGSLPHKNVDEAMNIVRQFYYDIPFCPQLPRLSKKEDMIVQYLENMPGIVFVEDDFYLDIEKETFSDELENLYLALEDNENIDEYGLTEEFSKAFKPFTEIVKSLKPKYAKAQVTGPFTLATSLTDKSGRCAYYDETLRDVVLKTLILKALWQIKEIKKACSSTTPIIFIDEPTLSQLGTSAFVTISPNEIIEIIKDLSDTIQQNGAISAIHCCGKCDWSIPIKVGMNILNFDAFSYAENMSLFASDLKDFLNNGGKIAWGIVPTLDKEALTNTDIKEVEEKLSIAKSYLINKGIDKNVIEENSLISPSCGCGSLSEELAQKAIKLTKELSDKLKG